MEKERAKEKIRGLIENYEKILNSKGIEKYNEEQTKKDFILPFFEALGWNVYGKDVSAEERVTSKRVDYAFYVNGFPVFFLEAKPPRVDLNKEEYAKQVINYSWNKGITWAILTDFEGIKIFNAQDIESSLWNKLWRSFSYKEYLENFDEIWLLSKEAFQEKLLDKKAEKEGKKLLKISVTDSLYKDLKICRDLLTKAFNDWNPTVHKDLLDEGVQRILDRIIFIRVAEDRGIENNTLVPMIRAWQSDKSNLALYQSMVNKFKELNEIYNSHIFAPHPSDSWIEHSNAVKEVIEILHGKEGYYQYDFKILPADVLGAVYENYLGYKLSDQKENKKLVTGKLVIHKDAKKRKEHGIYYTPTPIVEYIVRTALSPILNRCKSIEDLNNIKVLDPACGSGSFLIKAFEVIYEKYEEFGAKGEFVKLQILNQNLYGVDLDPQAVEIARLNLLISALEKRMKLPNLANIRNGNSLIFGERKILKKYFGANWQKGKYFNWDEEFPQVFKKGGFDVVIGNPPYASFSGRQTINIPKNEKNFLVDNYRSLKEWPTLHGAFIERSLMLTKENLSFIIPDQVGHLNSYATLRDIILENGGLREVKYWGENIFKDAVTPSLTFLWSKRYKGETAIYQNGKKKEVLIKEGDSWVLAQQSFLNDKVPVESLGDLVADPGVHTGNSGEKIIKLIKEEDNKCIPILEGKNVFPFFCEKPQKCLVLNYKPKEGEYFTIRKEEKYSNAYFLIRQTASYPIVGPRQHAVYFRNSLLALYSPTDGRNVKYLVGILNSKLINVLYRTSVQESGQRAFPQVKISSLRRLPIRKIDFSIREEKIIHDKIVEEVDNLLQLNSRLMEEEENSESWVTLVRRIEVNTLKMNELIYKLYKLSPEQIMNIEKTFLSLNE